jgi:uncharacterized membrane-anchored protein YitT (DUF2179 family)
MKSFAPTIMRFAALIMLMSLRYIIKRHSASCALLLDRWSEWKTGLALEAQAGWSLFFASVLIGLALALLLSAALCAKSCLGGSIFLFFCRPDWKFGLGG